MTDLWALWEDFGPAGNNPAAGPPALPLLAERPEPEAILLASAVVVQGGDELRTGQADAVAALLARATAALADPGHYFFRLLEAVLVFEGLHHHYNVIGAGVEDGEYEIECPECGTATFVLPEEGVARSHEGDERPLRPADPATLHGLGRRACDLAAAHGQDDTVLRYLFGQATCPECEADLTVFDELLVIESS